MMNIKEMRRHNFAWNAHLRAGVHMRAYGTIQFSHRFKIVDDTLYRKRNEIAHRLTCSSDDSAELFDLLVLSAIVRCLFANVHQHCTNAVYVCICFDFG